MDINKMNEMDIRADWKSALNAVDKGWDLSAKIQWGFSQQDLIVLGSLYNYGDMSIRQKIVDLLEDCNFHTECGLLCNDNIDEYFKVVLEED